MAKKFSDRYDNRKMRGFKWLKRAAVAAVVLFVLFWFVIGVSAVDGNSMCNTLQNGDILVYSRLNRQAGRGDVVALSLPSGEYYVKRVCAVAGDTVDIRDGELYVNGEKETAGYVLGPTLAESLSLTYPYVVEEGHVFVLGDNRPESVDSRYFGAVNLSQITGVIKLRLGFFYLDLL